MAEARLAVAFQFQVTDEGEIKVHLDRRILVDVYRSIRRVIRRKLFKSRNAAIQVTLYSHYLTLSLHFFLLLFLSNAFLRRRHKKALLRVNDRGGGWRTSILVLCRACLCVCVCVCVLYVL